MKKRSIQLAVLVVLTLTILLTVQALAAGQSQSKAQPTDRYFYQLVLSHSDQVSQEYLLYVQRIGADAAPLHAGSIALAAPLPSAMRFQPAAGVDIEPGSELVLVDNYDSGTLADGQYYISFRWRWEIQGTNLDNTDQDNQQLLGTLLIPRPDITADSITLLPWPETPTGQQQLENWKNAADPEAAMEILSAIWRMEDPQNPSEGYYQGFRDGEDTENPQGTQYSRDIAPGWYGFVLGCYDPEEPVTISIYQQDENGSYAQEAFAQKQLPTGTGVGYHQLRVDFSTLQMNAADGTVLSELPMGSYRMVVQKESHVTATFTGLTVSEKGTFPELLGRKVILPCGDVDEDGRIGQKDRALLTDASRYRLKAAADTNGKTLYDLDGDGMVNQVDLSILIAPANYGKHELTFNFH